MILDKKLLYLVNVGAGKGRIRGKLADITDIFTKGGYDTLVHTTQAPLDAYHVVREHAGEFDMIVCSGGDGTLNETLNGLLACENPPRFGYIPTGTTNDFASGLGIPKDLIKAARVIVDGTPFSCDIGKFNDRFFSYVAAFGAMTEIPYQTPQKAKNSFGYMAYLFEAMKRITEDHSYTLRVETGDQVYEGQFMLGLITNAAFVGGFKNIIYKNIEPDDGLFEVTLVRKPNNFAEFQTIINNAILHDVQSEYVYFVRSPRIAITVLDGEMPWTVDGEFGGAPERVVIENIHCGLSIMVPPRQSQALDSGGKPAALAPPADPALPAAE